MWATHAQAILALVTLLGVLVLCLPLLLIAGAAVLVNWYRYRHSEER